MNLRIRPCNPEDKQPIMQILMSLSEFEPYEVVIAEELIDTYLKDPFESGYHILVAELEKTVQGYICYGPTPLTKGTWDIYWIAVAQESKGQGIGKKLLVYTENNIRKEDGRLIILETSSKSLYAKARKFYEYNGYVTVCRIADFYIPGDDKIIYMKKF